MKGEKWINGQRELKARRNKIYFLKTEKKRKENMGKVDRKSSNEFKIVNQKQKEENKLFCEHICL